MEGDRDLVTLAKFLHEHEAFLLRTVLNEQGIPAIVAGNNSAGFGMNLAGLASVEVNVRRIDEPAARKILDEMKERAPAKEAWTCLCGAKVDEGFAVCWSCGRDIEDVRNELLED